ncbi:unnamed protein product [Rotaria sp. Silwood2]|nr:unnamed protein product [Rotaria sp. Silwood2]CAF4217994.1 unnamed protein product [Rotaria sp. Silwood2]
MACSKVQFSNNDNNLETYSIFWLDASVDSEENKAAQKQLRSIINQLRTFVDPEECMGRIGSIHQGDLTSLIVSGQLGRIVVPEMQKLQQVSSIYVYCFNKEANLQWSRPYSKVKAVCNNLNELINIIRTNQKYRVRLEESLGINVLDRSSTALNGEFLHSQLLIDVLIRMKPNEQDKKELIEMCKIEYKGNEAELRRVNEFRLKYESSKAVWWYTRESFVYRILNKALRVQNVDVLFLFRDVIRDILEQLRASQCRERITVFRGQFISKNEFKLLHKSIGNIISMNSFLSTTVKRDVALRFMKYNPNLLSSDDHVPVMFEIDADPRIIGSSRENSRLFAEIARFSDHKGESDVLFMLGSIFCLNEICHDQSSTDATISIIRMTLCSDHDNDLKQLYDHMKNEYYRGETNLLSLGDVMYKMGNSDLAEKYYRRLLSELPSNDPSLSRLYHNLGLVADAKGEYDTSLELYQKSLEIKMRTRPSDHVNIGNTLNSIGAVHGNKGDRSQALESYNRAVSLFKQAHDENHPKMAIFYNNIGLIYREQQKYSEALDFYEKSLAIRKKHLPADHPDLSASYNIIGSVHYYLSDYDLALEHYNRSLEIKLKILPVQHPDIAMAYENMSVVYEDKDELTQAVTLLKKAQTIYEASLPTNHPNVMKIKDSVRRVEDKLKSK